MYRAGGRSGSLDLCARRTAGVPNGFGQILADMLKGIGIIDRLTG